MLKNISIPEKLEKDIEKKLIGAYYSNLSDVIEDGLRKVLNDYETEKRLNTILKLYQEDKITAREASDLLGNG
ncbi:MAG: ribbon-helix-helix domain-containing protein [Methanosarcinales archaeon]